MDEHEVHEHFNRPSIGGITGGNPDTGGNDPDPDPEPDPNPGDDDPNGGQGGDGGDDGGDTGNTGDDGDDGGDTPTPRSLSDNPSTYSADDLDAMTVSAIKALAAELGYSLTATKKADIIEEFLAQQG